MTTPAARSLAFHFYLAGRRLALESSYLQRVVDVGAIASVPRSARELLGIFTHQGQFLPLLDLSALLGLQADTPRLAALVTYGEGAVGLGVDAIADFHPLNLDALSPVSSALSPELQAYGSGQLAFDPPTLLLDVPRLLSTVSTRLGVV